MSQRMRWLIALVLDSAAWNPVTKELRDVEFL